MSINGALVQATRHLSDMHVGTRSTKVSTAGALVQTIARSGDEDAEDQARTLFDRFKDSVELGNGLERAAQDSQDAMRKQKIDLMTKRIEQLKELLRFAAPEQTKRMLRELKQISREFKSVSKELGSSSDGLMSSLSGSGLQTSSVTTSTAMSATSLATVSQTATGTKRPVASGSAEVRGETTSDTAQGKITSDNTSQPEPAWQTELTAAISSYTQSQLETEQSRATSRQDRLRQDKEDLGKIAQNIQQLADALERLAKDDDKKTDKDLKDIRANLEDGLRDLGEADLKGSPLTGQAATLTSSLVSHVTSASSISLQSTDILV